MAESKQKPRSMSFAGEEALKQHKRLKDEAHRRGLFMWEVARDALDALEVIDKINSVRQKWVRNNPKDTASFVVEPGENGEVQFWRIEEDASGQERWTELCKPVSLRAYIAESEKTGTDGSN